MVMTHKGIVACGHLETARAAAAVLDAGGNAFDAALAAMCAACVAEPILASLGGGGFLLARPAGSGAAAAPLVFDFFGQTPKIRLPEAEIDFVPVEADFGSTRQEFHIGMGSVATPGVVKGLFEAHRALGRMPMREVVAPAVELARRGVATTPMQAYMAGVVGAILRHTPESFALLASPTRPGELVQAGDAYRFPELADVLEILAIEGEELFYRGEIAGRIAEGCRRAGGQLTMADLQGYRVEVRRPVESDALGARFYLNPPPSSGGILIAFALEQLRGFPFARHGPADPEYVLALAQVMAATNRARIEARLHELEAEDVSRAVLDPALLARYREELLGAVPGRGATTHISVVDGGGNAASLSISNGEGCGSVIPGTGIMLNNMLGEEDINPHGHHRWPEDRRLASMMTPVLALERSGAVTALGSGGSNRIRTAILQVLVNAFAFARPLDLAVAAPRLHVEGDKLSIEPEFPEPVLDALAGGFELDRWTEPSMFFGGVHAVRRDGAGGVTGAADERRDGAVLSS
jgi:gamma-glutamyltranspeptidase/glutathione hydrolase